MNAKQPLLRRLHPARLLFDLNLSAKFWFGMFLLTLFIMLVIQFASLRRRMSPLDGVIVVSGDGNMHHGTFQNWGAVTNLHVRMAEQATEAFLLRSPAGFDLPEQLDLLYLPEAAALARVHCESEAPDRQARELRQKPEIADVRYVRLADERIRVSLRGQRVQAGLFRGQPIADAAPFQLDLELVRNPNLALNGLAPFVVRSFHYETVHP